MTVDPFFDSLRASDEIRSLRMSRSLAIEKLGPRPPWWRPFRRSHWDKTRAALGRMYVDRALALSIRYAPGISREALEYTWS